MRSSRSSFSGIARALIAFAVAATLVVDSLAAVRGGDAAYVGGTVPDLKQGIEGSLDASDAKELRFDHKGGSFSLPYQQIVSMEFGQKVGRRVGAALVGMVFLGLPGLFILASKKKKHFLTIGYRDESGKGQAAVFELAKGTVSSMIPSLEARTGKRVEMEAGGDGWGDAGHAAAPHVPAPPPAPRVEPLPASLTIDSTAIGTEVIIDANPFGHAPITAKLPAGPHYIVLRKEGFTSWTRDVDAKAGETMMISADLKPIAESPNVITIK